jgi:hypothetical protein
MSIVDCKVSCVSGMSRAMPTARATRSPTRARILGLGLAAGIAIAVTGCAPEYPSAKGFWHNLIYGNPAKTRGMCK